MKCLLIGLFCVLSCMDAKINYTVGRKKPHYKVPIILNSSGSEKTSSHVTSKHDLLNAFNKLVQVGYGTRLQRWVIYLWRNKTEKERAQENLEKELLNIKKNHRVDYFIKSVQKLQQALQEMRDTMKSDAAYNPAIVFHDDGSVTVNDEQYTFAETSFADI